MNAGTKTKGSQNGAKVSKWKENQLNMLVYEIENHRGQGESKKFYQIKELVKLKIGTKAWENLLHKAKLIVVENNKRKNNGN